MIRKEAIVFGIVAWVVLTFLFMEDKTATDGYTILGFPWHFYSYKGDKIAYVDQSHLGLNFSNFILDLTILGAFIYGVNVFLERNLKKKTNSDKPTYL